MVISGDLTTCINETYSGNKIMAAYELQPRQSKSFTDNINKLFSINMSLSKRVAWMSPMTHFIASIGIAVVLGSGTYLINSGHMTSGSFASFIASLLLLYRPIKTFGNALTSMQTTFVAMSRIFELFDLRSEIKEKENPQSRKKNMKTIIVSNQKGGIGKTTTATALEKYFST